MVTIVHAQPSSSNLPAQGKYQKELHTLSQELAQSGYHIDSLFANRRFKIYDEIGDHFRNAPERTTPTLAQYKKILGFHAKVGQGVQFVHAHRKTLKKAARIYDIPGDVIAAIIGIESSYGKNYGSYNPFNVYVSMIVVNYRSDFAEAQLKQLLDFAHRNNVDIFSLKSSYAGAVSYAQFIPRSLNKWFVGDDIFSMYDNIMSVGNYLAHFKEKTGSLRTAVLRYNPSTLYRDAVLDLADAIGKAAK
jgi:membrane-bound lytic murein transglycosylase B